VAKDFSPSREIFSEQQFMGLWRGLVHQNGWMVAPNGRAEALGHEEASRFGADFSSATG
jgi:hypothetical protein